MSGAKSEVELRLAGLSKARQQLVKLAAKGTSIGQMARILGVQDAAVSKALDEPKVRELVNDLRYEVETQVADQDTKLDRIQGKLIDKLEDAVDNIWKPQEIVATLEKIAKIPRRSSGETPAGSTTNATIVQVSLPLAARQFLVQKNGNNQIVQAGEQTLVTMQSHEVARRFANKEVEVTEIHKIAAPVDKAELIRAQDTESSLGVAAA